MAVKTWKVQPLYMTIIEVLEKKGSMTDTELLEFLKAFDKDTGMSDLSDALMRMEVTGLINVSSLSKGKRLVELSKKAK
jgi:ABC-type transport system involved in cytochrome c biogenesis ATPase subunit